MRYKVLVRFFGTFVLHVSLQAGCTLREYVDPAVSADSSALLSCAPDHSIHTVQRPPAIAVTSGEADGAGLEARLQQ